jgi:GT2 family glycosyltransferase
MARPSPAARPFIDVIVVMWKSAPFLDALVASLAVIDYPRERLRVHFVENGPHDGSLAALAPALARHAGALPAHEVVTPGRNTGFAGGNNLVLQRLLDARETSYAYLLNHDAVFEPGALRQAIAVAESHPDAASVQSLVVLADEPDSVNTSGNAIHYLGFGYCGGFRSARADVPSHPVDIPYASGAGALYRLEALREVGLFDESLFAYHEDLDLGWRLRAAGYRNLLAPGSVVRHRYEFSRSPEKWFLLERNRMLVVLKNYRAPTLAVLAPQLIALELALLAYAARAGWWPQKLRAWRALATPVTWRGLAESRRKTSLLRRVPDAELLRLFTPFLEYPGIETDAVRRYAYPVFRAGHALARVLVRW